MNGETFVFNLKSGMAFAVAWPDTQIGTFNSERRPGDRIQMCYEHVAGVGSSMQAFAVNLDMPGHYLMPGIATSNKNAEWFEGLGE
jgi:hypothetical protein